MAISPHVGSLAINGSNVTQLISFTLPGSSRESVDAYHLGDSVMKTRPSRITDPGEGVFDISYDNTLHSTLYALRTGLTDSTFAATLPGFGTLAWSGYITTFENSEIERSDSDNFTATITVKSNSIGIWS